MAPPHPNMAPPHPNMAAHRSRRRRLLHDRLLLHPLAHRPGGRRAVSPPRGGEVCGQVPTRRPRVLHPLLPARAGTASPIWHVPRLIWHAPTLIWHVPTLIWHAPTPNMAHANPNMARAPASLAAAGDSHRDSAARSLPERVVARRHPPAAER
eukprot:4274091-Prymnesium_polylepis.1